MHRFALMLSLAAGLAGGLTPAIRAQLPDPLPAPDGKSADMSKPVQVYILMGQSNMLGFGKVKGLQDACKNKGLYPYLLDDSGGWSVRKDVRYVRVMCSGPGPRKIHNNEWMTIKGNIGPEMGIGHYVGHVTKAPVLILKSCIGNRSLGWDLLPPTADGYAGNKKGPRKPIPGDWYAGMQYDGDVRAAKEVLAQLGKYYPGAKRYQVAGFFWWQGDKDFRNADHAAAYEKNLLCLIESLRKDFKAPNARFVCATLGQTKKGAGGPQGKILEAQLNIDGNKGKYKSHKGKVATVYSHPLSKGGSSSGHYSGNAETYMNVGQAMGQAMARLIQNSPEGIPGVELKALGGGLKGVYKNVVAGNWSRADEGLRAFYDSPGASNEAQMGLASKLEEHLYELVEGFVADMESCFQSGDYLRLRDELAKTGKGCVGMSTFDKRQAEWAAALATDDAKQAMAAGEELRRLVAQKARMKRGVFFAAVEAFQDKYSGSFYARQAEEEIAPTRRALQKMFDEVRALERRGDHYAKYELIKKSRDDFERIAAFEEADDKWSVDAKQPEVKEGLVAGAAYVGLMEDVDEQNKRYAAVQAKNKKVTGSKREKAEKKAEARHQKVLKTIAGKLKKLADKYGDSYYGKAAFQSYESWDNTYGREIKDGRGK